MTTTGTDSRRLRLGTRGSRLALAQSGQVAEALRQAAGGGGGLGIDLVTVRTDGDGDRTPLRQLGGVGVWTVRWTWWSTPSRTCPRSGSRAWRSSACLHARTRTTPCAPATG